MTSLRSRRRTARGAAAFALPLLLGVGIPPAGAAPAADADLSVVGGDTVAQVVCGNVAEARALAATKGVRLQRSNCTADAAGGDVALSDVDIHIPAAARNASPGNAALAALAAGTAPRPAVDVCRHLSPRAGTAPGRPVQRNVCWAKGSGGRARVSGTVVGVVTRPDGTRSRRAVSAADLPAFDGSAGASCTNRNAAPLRQEDWCSSSGGGASLSLTGVTVVQHRADGTSTTRRDIDVTVRGGTAVSQLYCFNVVDSAGRVVQINVCRGTAEGGDITLRNVTVHTSS